jgi:hypothetical protein
VIIIKNTTTLDNGFCVTKFPINSIIWALKMMMFVLVCLFAVSFHFFEVFSFQIFTPKTEKNYWRGFLVEPMKNAKQTKHNSKTDSPQKKNL